MRFSRSSFSLELMLNLSSAAHIEVLKRPVPRTSCNVIAAFDIETKNLFLAEIVWINLPPGKTDRKVDKCEDSDSNIASIPPESFA